MSDNMNEVGWDDSSIRLSELTFFKGEKSCSKRIFIMTPRPSVARVHYQGGYFFCHSTFELQDGVQTMGGKAQCCELMGKSPELRFGVVVCVYDTKKNGTLKPRDAKNPAELEFEFQIWRFKENVFASLKTKNEEWDLTKHDLLISCTEEQYQRLDIDVAKSTWRTANADLKKRIDREYELYKYKDIYKFLGTNISLSEVSARLGGETEKKADTEVGKVNDEEFDTMLQDLQNDTPGKTKSDGQLSD